MIAAVLSFPKLYNLKHDITQMGHEETHRSLWESLQCLIWSE